MKQAHALFDCGVAHLLLRNAEGVKHTLIPVESLTRLHTRYQAWCLRVADVYDCVFCFGEGRCYVSRLDYIPSSDCLGEALKLLSRAQRDNPAGLTHQTRPSHMLKGSQRRRSRRVRSRGPKAAIRARSRGEARHRARARCCTRYRGLLPPRLLPPRRDRYRNRRGHCA